MKKTLLGFLVALSQVLSCALETHDDFTSLPVRNETVNTTGRPQGPYEIDGKTFMRQNVGGFRMRCFFNAMGLRAEDQVKKLRDHHADPLLRYMIGNEFVASVHNPEQISDKIKDVIGYSKYAKKRLKLDLLEEERNSLVTDDYDMSNLPEHLKHLRERGESLLNDFRTRCCSVEAFNAFLDHHIMGREMMVTLLDVAGNGINNLTSIDAVAYANNIGIKIMVEKGDKTLFCIHEFIPAGAKELKYLYHSGVHFQALNFVSEPEEKPVLDIPEAIRKFQEKGLTNTEIGKRLGIDRRRIPHILKQKKSAKRQRR